jgi:hypothetical protein
MDDGRFEAADSPAAGRLLFVLLRGLFILLLLLLAALVGVRAV